MGNLENNHDFVYFDDDSYICKLCGIWARSDGALIPRAEELICKNNIYYRSFYENNVYFFTCDKYRKKSEHYINKIKHLGHKWKPNTPSVFTHCEVCDIEFLIHNGAWVYPCNTNGFRGFSTYLKSCDEIVMNKVLV